MHKPIRPKSAKGKSRPTRNTQRTASQRQNNDSPLRNSQTIPASLSNSNFSQQQQSTFTSSYITQTESSPSLAASNCRPETPSSVELFPQVTRPTSSLSRYRILPSINGSTLPSAGDSWFSGVGSEIDGRISEMDLLTEQAQQMILDSSTRTIPKHPTPPSSGSKRKVTKAVPSGDSKRPKIYQTRSIFSSSKNNVIKEPPKPRVPREPGPNEPRILLALKLPDGTRVERYFHPHARLIGILAYAHSQYPILPVSQCNLYRMDIVPKKLLAQTDLSLEDVGIQNRTVLYVEEKDDD